MNTHSDQATPAQPAQQTAYNAPELIDYGPIEVLTQAVAGDPTDGVGGSVVN